MGWQCKSQEGGQFFWEWGFLLGIVKYFIEYLFYLYYCCFNCFVWDWQDQKSNLKCPKVSDVCTVVYSVCTVIFACTHPCDTSTFTHSLKLIHLLQLKNYNVSINFLKSKTFPFRRKRNLNPKVIHINYF